jgi:thiol-disulfide isomerase/thioredoxin
MRVFLGWIFFPVFLVAVGCSKTSETDSLNANSSIAIEFIDESGYEDLVDNRNGKILLVNFWATWCIPCRAEFPDLVKIAKDYKDKNLEVIGISADIEEEIESKVKPFLKAHQTPFKNYVKNVEDDGAFIDFVSKEWRGALPATFVYDAEGQLKTYHIGKADYEKFRVMIENADLN